MTLRKSLASVVLLLALAAIGVALAGAPLHRRYTADECRAAYAGARSQTDSAHIDLRRYVPRSGALSNRRCGEVRAVAIDSSADISKR